MCIGGNFTYIICVFSRFMLVFHGNLLEKTVVQTSSFAPGIYVIKLDSGKTFEFQKIIKE